jgi:subtilisin-like proprotein convertase family protein
MKSFVRLFAIVLVATTLASGQITRQWSTPSVVSVPSFGTGGLAGGLSNPANLGLLTANCQDAIVVSYLHITVNLAHWRVGDLTINLSHCGTTVTLFAGSANQFAIANGDYTFHDTPSISFSAAANQTVGTLPSGTYAPLQPLSAFYGHSSAGPWILTIADLAAGVSGSAGPMSITADSGIGVNSPLFPSLAIPDGSGGNCVVPVSQAVNVLSSAQVGMMNVSLNITHPWISDLTVVLSHDGVSATIMSPAAPTSGANLSGLYTFEDWAPASFAQTAATYANSATVPPGSYRPLTPLSVFQGLDQVGPWFLTVCDSAGQDVGHLDGVFLKLAPGSWDLQIVQPNGPASATVSNSGGHAGHSYANMMTLTPGAFPHGWLHGIDMTLLEIAAEISAGAPFFGALDPCGSASTTFSGPIPSGFTIYMTGLELDPTGSIVNFKPGFVYTTP